jgi:hypothetical protein
MTTVYAIHSVDGSSEQYEAVRSFMAENGAPTIRVVDCGDYLQALEGSHRLAIAAELGIEPRFDILEQDEIVSPAELALEGFDDEQEYTAGEIAGEVFCPRQSVPFTFNAGIG